MDGCTYEGQILKATTSMETKCPFRIWGSANKLLFLHYVIIQIMLQLHLTMTNSVTPFYLAGLELLLYVLFSFCPFVCLILISFLAYLNWIFWILTNHKISPIILYHIVLMLQRMSCLNQNCSLCIFFLIVRVIRFHPLLIPIIWSLVFPCAYPLISFFPLLLFIFLFFVWFISDADLIVIHRMPMNFWTIYWMNWLTYWRKRHELQKVILKLHLHLKRWQMDQRVCMPMVHKRSLLSPGCTRTSRLLDFFDSLSLFF